MPLLHPQSPPRPAGRTPGVVAPLTADDYPVAAALLAEGIAFAPEVLARIFAARAAAGTLPTLLGLRAHAGGPLLGAALLDGVRPVAGGRWFMRVAVALPARGRGVGSALFAALRDLRPAGSPPLSVEVDLADLTAQAVCAHWGGVAYQRSLQLELDLPAVRPAPPAPPAGVVVHALSERSPERLWQAAFAVYTAAALDLPDRAGAPAPSYDMFRAQIDHAPGVHLAWRHGRPVGLTGAGPDGPDTWYVFFTGTTGAARRGGVARALKHALHATAAAEGVRRLATSTLDLNTPMLRLNTELGYRVVGGIVRLQVA